MSLHPAATVYRIETNSTVCVEAEESVVPQHSALCLGHSDSARAALLRSPALLRWPISLLILIVSLRSCSRAATGFTPWAARSFTRRLLLLFQMRGIDAQDCSCSFQPKRHLARTLTDIRLKAVPKNRGTPVCHHDPAHTVDAGDFPFRLLGHNPMGRSQARRHEHAVRLLRIDLPHDRLARLQRHKTPPGRSTVHRIRDGLPSGRLRSV